MAGGAATADEDEGSITGINVTPFVDIALVLLIIFMVTAKYVVAPHAIPLDLPSGVPPHTNAVNVTIAVSVDAAGAIVADTRPFNDAGLMAYVRERHRESPDVRVIIAAGDAVPHGRVVRIIDLVRRGGVTRFAIQTQAPAAATGGAP